MPVATVEDLLTDASIAAVGAVFPEATEPAGPYDRMGSIELAALASSDLDNRELLSALHSRDLGERRAYSDAPLWRGGRIPAYSDDLLAALYRLAGWDPYAQEINRRMLAPPAPREGRTFTDLARDWIATGSRLNHLDRELRRHLAEGPIVVDDEQFDMDPYDGTINRFPVRHGDRIPVDF